MEFDPTPKFKSSLEPILFIPFDNNEDRCRRCMNPYSKTRIYGQKYCISCMLWYINAAGNDDILDVYIVSVGSQVYTHGVKEWREGCSEVFYFRQVSPGQYGVMTDGEIGCSLCEKFYQSSHSVIAFRLCPDCYQISSGFSESAPTLSLPWWDTSTRCNVCHSVCINSSCRKLCLTCRTTYVGCRHCLTTNIIFGFANKSQCRKCKRVTYIPNIGIGNGDTCIDKFLNAYHDENSQQINQYINYIRNDDNKNYNCFISVYEFLNNKIRYTQTISWFLHSDITNLVKISEGGFGIMCKATLSNRTVAIKRFGNPYQFTGSFLDKLKEIQLCRELSFNVMKCLGITQDPQTREYMLIMEYVREGDLHKYLQSSFTNIKWLKKLQFVWEISKGLESIHKNNFVHRYLHSGNIMMSPTFECQISDFGIVPQPVSSNEIYGVLPYIAPEIFKGATYSKESDIYSFGMMIWEITSGCKPFANVEHNADLINRIVDGERPEITSDTPECFENLMKRCWDSNPEIRPTAKDICNTCYGWLGEERDAEQFDQAEKKRAEMVLTSPVFARGSHPGAIYTSRSLSSLISNSTNFRMNQENHSIHSIQETETQHRASFSISSILNAPENNQEKRSIEGLETQKPTKKKVIVEADDDDDSDHSFSDDYYSSENERLLAEEVKRKYKRSGGDNSH